MVDKIDTVLAALRADVTLTTLLQGPYVYWLKPSTAPTPDSYITLFEVNNSESESADDEEYANDIEIQVDIWTPGSIIPIKKRCQSVMRALGFIHQALPDEWEEKIKKYHKSIRFMTTETV